MKRELMFATVLAAALSIGVSAQTPTGSPQTPTGQAGQAATPQSPASPGMEKQAMDKSEITLTGCIASGAATSSTTAGTAGTTGSSATAPAPSSPASPGMAPKPNASQFVLTDASSEPSASPSAAPSPTVSSSDRIALSGKDKDLQKLVGQKVEISGKWDKSSAPVSSNTFKVSSVKPGSGSCSK